MAELVDAPASGAGNACVVRVRVSLFPPKYVRSFRKKFFAGGLFRLRESLLPRESFDLTLVRYNIKNLS